jgi:hypothetical protein
MADLVDYFKARCGTSRQHYNATYITLHLEDEINAEEAPVQT